MCISVFISHLANVPLFSYAPSSASFVSSSVYSSIYSSFLTLQIMPKNTGASIFGQVDALPERRMADSLNFEVCCLNITATGLFSGAQPSLRIQTSAYLALNKSWNGFRVVHAPVAGT
ncbi:unnamed protein product, partial [Protopolystoma xenopodis]